MNLAKKLQNETEVGSEHKEQPETTNYEKLQAGMFILCLLIVMPNILSGMSQTYSAVALPEMNLTIDESSWFASSPFFTAPIGVLLQGAVIDTFGRKSALLVNIIPHFLGWSFIYWNRDLTFTLIGRFLCGLTTPSMFYAPQVYAVECITINNPKLAANFRVWPSIADSSGMLLTYLLGVHFSYLQISAFAVAFSFIMFCVIGLFIPESPSWLYAKGRIGDAEVAEKKLGISQPILKSPTKSPTLPTVKVFKVTPSNLGSVFEQMRRREVVKPLIIMSIISILIALIGGTALMAYTVDIMKDTPTSSSVSWKTNEIIRKVSVAWDSTNAYYYSVISGCLILVSVILASFILPIVGVRKLTLGCTLIMLVGWSSMGYTATRTGFYWLHVVGVWLALIGFFLGAMNAPVSVLSDAFPQGRKGLASIPIIFFSLTSALTNKAFPYLHVYLGGNAYFVFAGICVVYALFVYFSLPETVGRTYEEINADYMKVCACC